MLLRRVTVENLSDAIISANMLREVEKRHAAQGLFSFLFLFPQTSLESRSSFVLSRLEITQATVYIFDLIVNILYRLPAVELPGGFGDRRADHPSFMSARQLWAKPRSFSARITET